MLTIFRSTAPRQCLFCRGGEGKWDGVGGERERKGRGEEGGRQRGYFNTERCSELGDCENAMS